METKIAAFDHDVVWWPGEERNSLQLFYKFWYTMLSESLSLSILVSILIYYLTQELFSREFL